MREVWQTRKKESEEAFKKAHAAELLNVHQQGLTPYPVKFDLGLGPMLKSLEAAQKDKKLNDVTKYKGKAKEIVGKYRTRTNTAKTALGPAWEALDKGLTYLEGLLK
jgi:hypothetical protein